MNTREPADWSEIHRRIDAIRAAIAAGGQLTAEEERHLLHTRAQALAHAPADESAAGEMLEVVEFGLGGESYAFPLAQVRAVSLLHALTPVPGTPHFVMGIINVRGEIRTVIDLQRFFARPAIGLTQLNRFLLIAHDDLQLGVLADIIRGVRRVPLADLQPAPADDRAAYVRGVTGDRLVVLDAATLLADPRLLVEDRDET